MKTKIFLTNFIWGFAGGLLFGYLNYLFRNQSVATSIRYSLNAGIPAGLVMGAFAVVRSNGTFRGQEGP